jgi:tol-pal system protein YbgF
MLNSYPYSRLGVTFVLVGVGLAAGCATVPPEQDPVYLKLQELESRLVRIERVVENQSLAGLVSEQENLRGELQVLRNDVETLQHDNEQAAERQRSIYGDLDERLGSLEKSGAPIGGDLGVLDGGSLGPGQLPVPGGTDRANYQAAFELLKQGRYDQASMAFRQFMVAFPDSSLSDNAQYWLAETHYVSQSYEDALTAFQIVLDEYPNSRKLPDALLKIGYCNYELARWGAARDSLGKVASAYPETTAARLANQRLERMREEGR